MLWLLLIPFIWWCWVGTRGEKAGRSLHILGSVLQLLSARLRWVEVASIPTVPSKTLRESALYFSGLKQRGLYGIDYSLKENLTVQDFMHHERAVVEMERSRILKNLELHRIELVQGQAAFEDGHTVASLITEELGGCAAR